MLDFAGLCKCLAAQEVCHVEYLTFMGIALSDRKLTVANKRLAMQKAPSGPSMPNATYTLPCRCSTPQSSGCAAH